MVKIYRIRLLFFSRFDRILGLLRCRGGGRICVSGDLHGILDTVRRRYNENPDIEAIIARFYPVEWFIFVFYEPTFFPSFLPDFWPPAGWGRGAKCVSGSFFA